MMLITKFSGLKGFKEKFVFFNGEQQFLFIGNLKE